MAFKFTRVLKQTMAMTRKMGASSKRTAAANRRTADQRLAAQKRHRLAAQKRVAVAEKAANQRIARAKKAQERAARLASAPARSRHISMDVKREVWRRDNRRCVECGSKINLEFDHIIPFSKGGSSTQRNVQLLCESCNRKKHGKIM